MGKRKVTKTAMSRKKAKPKAIKKSWQNQPDIRQYFVRTADGTSVAIAYDTYSALQMFNSWCFRAADLNASYVAHAPRRVYARDNSGALSKKWKTKSISWAQRKHVLDTKGIELSSDFVEITDIRNPLVRLLSRPNPLVAGSGEFDYSRMICRQIWGNYYIRVIKDADGMPSQMYVLEGNKVKLLRPNGIIEGYEYNLGNGRKETYKPEEIIHGRRSNPADMYGYGKSNMEAAWGAVWLDDKKRNMDLALTLNLGLIGTVFSLPAGTGEDEIKRRQIEVHNQYGGYRNAGKAVVVGGDTTVTPIQYPNLEIGSKENVVIEIGAAFGIPDSMMFMRDSNLATSRQGNLSWLIQTIKPLLMEEDEVWNSRLLPMFGADFEENVVIAYDNPIKQDEETLKQSARADVGVGVMTPNEYRTQILGLEPLEGGDALQLAFTSDLPSEGSGDASGEPQEAQPSERGAPPEVQPDPGQDGQGQTKNFGAELEHKQFMAVGARQLYPALKAAFALQRELVLNDIKAAWGDAWMTEGKALQGKAARLSVSMDKYNADLSSRLKPSIQTIAERKAQTTRRRLGGSTSADVSAKVEAAAGDFSTGVTQHAQGSLAISAASYRISRDNWTRLAPACTATASRA